MRDSNEAGTCPKTPPPIQGQGEASGAAKRWCTKCGAEKSVEDFPRKRGGLDSICRSCKCQKQREYRKTLVPDHSHAARPHSESHRPKLSAQEMTPEEFQQIVKYFEILRRWRDMYDETNSDVA